MWKPSVNAIWLLAAARSDARINVGAPRVERCLREPPPSSSPRGCSRSKAAWIDRDLTPPARVARCGRTGPRRDEARPAMADETRVERWLDRKLARVARPRQAAAVIAAVTTSMTV